MTDSAKSVDEIIAAQKQPTKTVLSSLLAVQDELGYISDQSIAAVAKFCEATINEVWSVASYYTNFRFAPPGDNIFEVCWGPTCHLLGAQAILRKAQEVLGVNGESEGADTSVSLRYNTCLGACALAPLVAVNHTLRGRQTAETVEHLLKELMTKGKSKH